MRLKAGQKCSDSTRFHCSIKYPATGQDCQIKMFCFDAHNKSNSYPTHTKCQQQNIFVPEKYFNDREKQYQGATKIFSNKQIAKNVKINK